MKKIQYARRSAVGAFILAVLICPPAFSQVDLKLGGGLGLVVPAGDFGGSTSDYYNGTQYGLGNGVNIQGKAKVGLASLNLVGEIDYASMSNSGASEPGLGTVEVSQTIVSLKAGPEFHLGLPLVPVSPYIGANISVNRFSGETTFQGVSKIPSGTYSMKDATRIGIGFTAGTEVSIGPLMSLDVNLSYNLMNLSGKEWEDVDPGKNERIDSYRALNDSDDPLYVSGDDKHFAADTRSIHTILFTVSVLFGI